MRDYTFERKKAATSSFSNPSLVSPHTPTLANPERGFGLPTNNIVQAQTVESANQQPAQAADEKSKLLQTLEQPSFGHDLSRYALRRPQAKLTVGEPGDKYEQEADWMANQVMRMVVPNHLNAQSVQPVQDSLQRKCAACAEEEDKVQTKPSIQTATDGGLQAGNNIESRLNSSKGGGSPLAPDVRSFMEPRFGADFSGVQVHTGSDAVQMNRELNAQAFTHGSDVYFGAGKSAGNNELTAHELTHVVQQNSGIQAKSNTQAEILQRDCDPTLASCPPDQTTTPTPATSDQTSTPVTNDSQADDQAIMQMDKIGKLMAAVKSALIQAPEKFGSQVNALLQPEALLEFAMWTEVFAALQATPAGWGADLAIIGLEAYLIGPLVVKAIDDLVEFFDTAIDAQDKKAIDQAGAALADALGILGIALLMKLLFHGSDEVEPEKAPSGEVEIKPKAEETPETPKEEPTPNDEALLENTANKPSNTLSPEEINTERRIAERGKAITIDEPPFTIERDLPNGHTIKETPTGDLIERCSFCAVFDKEGNLVSEETEGHTEEPKAAERAQDVAEDIGVQQGKEAALKMEMQEANWVNPLEPQGIDDVRIGPNGNDVVCEYKGGEGKLEGDQGSRDWVQRKINEMKAKQPNWTYWADRLQAGLDNGTLSCWTFETKIGTDSQLLPTVGTKLW